MTSLMDIIRADNKRYAALLDFLELANVTADGPPQRGTHEGRVSQTEPDEASTGKHFPATGKAGTGRG